MLGMKEAYLLGDALHALADDHAAWSRATFGTDAERGPVGPLRHLAKEAVEAADACVLAGVGPGKTVSPEAADAVLMELADCLLLVLDASRRAGLSPADLIDAAAEKMAVNKARRWPTPTADTPVEHVR